MKKISFFVTLILLAISLCPTVSAYDNISDIISGNQDYLVLGTVVDINNDSVILEHYQTIDVDVSSTDNFSRNQNITIDKFRYSYCDKHSDISTIPRVGDNVFISLNKKGSSYIMVNGAYKITSVDYKMLTFYASESMKGQDCLADIVALAYFVRTNGVGRDFTFEKGTLTANLDGKKLTLYPTDNITETVTFVDVEGNIVDAAKTKDVIIHGEETNVENEDDYRWVFACLGIVLSAALGGFVIHNSPNFKGKETK